MGVMHHACTVLASPSLILTSTNVGDEVLNTLLGEELGKEAGPVGLDLDLGSLGQGQDVVGGDLQTVIGQDQGLRSRIGVKKGGVAQCCFRHMRLTA